MENKKEKWEIQYEKYKNGELDAKKKELEKKYKNKEIDIKKYNREKTRLDRISSNLPKIGHLVELRNELIDLRLGIEKEILRRINVKNELKEKDELDKKMQELDKENEELLLKIEETKKKLKSKSLSDDEREKLKKELSADEEKLKKNDSEFKKSNEMKKKYIEKDGKENLEDTKLSKIDTKDLKEYYSKICMKLSRNNFFAKKLLRGSDMEYIKSEDEKVDWDSKKYNVDPKRLVAIRNEAKKINRLGEVSGDNGEKQKSKEEHSEENAMIEVDEFDKKHPRLAKIKQFFSNIKNKIFNRKGKEDESEQENVSKNKNRDFVKRLKDMEKYDIVDVAEKGMGQIKDDKMSEAKRRLLENKQKSARESKEKYEQGLNDFYKKNNINKTKSDNTNYLDNEAVSKLDDSDER